MVAIFLLSRGACYQTHGRRSTPIIGLPAGAQCVCCRRN
jgi:hypothetical protein